VLRPRGARRHRWADFLRQLLAKAEEDNIFFMAGAISFNVLVAFVPLLLFAVGVAGMVLSARFGDPAAALLDLVQDALPAIRGDIDLVTTVRDQIAGILDQRRGFTVLGALLLLWFSTRLVGTLRTALREIFDMAEDRGLIRGKLFDIQMVLAGSVLLLVNLGLSALVQTAERAGVEVLGLEGATLGWFQTVTAQGLAFISIWVLFLAIYRYLPARRIPWKAALIAATFTAVLHELLKEGFGWYVTEVANYRTTYGNLITLAVLIFWIYYESIGFILGGEAAQVWTMQRARRVRTRRALFGGK
jgi:membrane protein